MPVNAKSLKNLNRRGKKKIYDEDKKQRYLSVTETGWEGVLTTVKQLGFSGVSELIEKIGRNEVVVVLSEEGVAQKSKVGGDR
jgi:hypothetical protein